MPRLNREPPTLEESLRSLQRFFSAGAQPEPCQRTMLADSTFRCGFLQLAKPNGAWEPVLVTLDGAHLTCRKSFSSTGTKAKFAVVPGTEIKETYDTGFALENAGGGRVEFLALSRDIADSWVQSLRGNRAWVAQQEYEVDGDEDDWQNCVTTTSSSSVQQDTAAAVASSFTTTTTVAPNTTTSAATAVSVPDDSSDGFVVGAPATAIAAAAAVAADGGGGAGGGGGGGSASSSATATTTAAGGAGSSKSFGSARRIARNSLLSGSLPSQGCSFSDTAPSLARGWNFCSETELPDAYQAGAQQ
jgi:hypothetical protein